MKNEAIKMHQAEAERLKNRVVGQIGELLYTLHLLRTDCPTIYDDDLLKNKEALDKTIALLVHHMAEIRREFRGEEPWESV